MLLKIAVMAFLLAFVLSFLFLPKSQTNQVARQLSNYVISAQEQFDKLCGDTVLLNQIAARNVPERAMDVLVAYPQKLYCYTDSTSDQPFFWTSNSSIPNKTVIFSEDSVGYNKLANGSYVWQKHRYKELILISLLPIKYDFPVENKYLRNDFAQKLSGVQIVDHGGAPILAQNGKILFGITGVSKGKTLEGHWLVSLLNFVGLVGLFLFFSKLAALQIAGGKNKLAVVGILVFCVLAIRVLMYLLPDSYFGFDLLTNRLDNAEAASLELGNRLINALLALWLSLYVRFFLYNDKFLKQLFARHKLATLLISSFAIVGVTYAGVATLKKLVTSSNISFDVVNFFSLDYFSVIGFIIICCITIAYFIFIQLIVDFLKPNLSSFFWEIYLSISMLSLIGMSFGIIKIESGLEVMVLLWLLMFVFLLHAKILNTFITKFLASVLVFWLMFFSISITAVILKANNQKDINQRQHYAEIIATKTDQANENLMKAILNDFNNTFLSQNIDRFKIADTAKAITDSIISTNIIGYAASFETTVFVFDSLQNSASSDGASYNQLNAIFKQQAKPTSVNNLFYYDEGYDSYSYIIKREVRNYFNDLQGYVFLLASTGKSGLKLYPEIFSRGTELDIGNSSDIAFALYHQGNLVRTHNDYIFQTKAPRFYYAGKKYLLNQVDGYDELWYNAGKGREVVIVKKNTDYIQSITLFSYLFCGFLVLMGLFMLINFLLTTDFSSGTVWSKLSVSIRHQVHGTVLFISLLSFLVIGVVTTFIFIERYNQNIRERMSNNVHLLATELRSEMYRNNFDSIGNLPGVAKNIEFADAINKMAAMHNVNFNIYDLNGLQLISSLPFPYETGIVSRMMDARAYYNFDTKNYSQYFQNERIGTLDYMSIYYPLKDNFGNNVGILNIPNYASGSNLKQEVSRFIITLINLNAFIFIIAGIIALYITNRITSSFAIIRDKMRKTTLGKLNEPIDWERNDEIKGLVVEYNRMVKELEKSVQALAKTEREGAWAMMARQVAHEIKNPLTPMKLSMQFMQMAIDSKDSNLPDIAKRMSKTMIEQIDHLAQIANEFSQFANIEHIELGRTSVNKALHELQGLYTFNDKVKIKWELLEEEVFAMADKTQFNRLLTNILLNGIQAVPPERDAELSVVQTLDRKNVVIKIADNGTGIPEEMREKIFFPNFTTKSSGTGLGLLMCKRIVEKMEGTIDFESTINVGTNFIITIPTIS